MVGRGGLLEPHKSARRTDVCCSRNRSAAAPPVWEHAGSHLGIGSKELVAVGQPHRLPSPTPTPISVRHVCLLGLAQQLVSTWGTLSRTHDTVNKKMKKAMAKVFGLCRRGLKRVSRVVVSCHAHRSARFPRAGSRRDRTPRPVQVLGTRQGRPCSARSDERGRGAGRERARERHMPYKRNCVLGGGARDTAPVQKGHQGPNTPKTFPVRK